MRRLFVMLLVLCLIGAGAYAREDAAMKAAFDVYSSGDADGGITLSSAAVDVSEMEIWCAASAREMMDESGISRILGESDDGRLLFLGTGKQFGLPENAFEVTDISPRGDVMFGMLDTMRACVAGNRVILQTYAAERSAPDADGIMERYNRGANTLAVTKRALDGVVWSPDGSMAAITNGYDTLMKLDVKSDPLIIMDVYSGEYYAATTAAKKVNLSSATFPLAACFDETGRYVYCLMCGRGLIEHDTVENTNRCVGSAGEYDRFAYPTYLSRLSDGRLVFPIMTAKQQTGIGVFTPSAGVTELPYAPTDFPEYANISECVGKFEFSFIERASQFGLRALNFNAENGCGLAYCDDMVRKAGRGCFSVIDANAGFAGINDFLMITTDGRVEKLTGDEITSLDDRALSQYDSVLNACLSPDGRHVLVNTQECMYICDPEKPALVRIDYPEGVVPGDWSYFNHAKYARGTSWQADRLLVTADGLYEFAWDEAYVEARKPAAESVPEAASATETAPTTKIAPAAANRIALALENAKSAYMKLRPDEEIQPSDAVPSPGDAVENDADMKPAPVDGAPVPKAGWTCPGCGWENDADMKFCPNDGTPRPLSAWTCPSCGRENDADMNFCPNDAAARP